MLVCFGKKCLVAHTQNNNQKKRKLSGLIVFKSSVEMDGSDNLGYDGVAKSEPLASNGEK